MPGSAVAGPDDRSPRRALSEAEAQRSAEALKERVYVTFTALAVTIALVRNADHVTAGSAAVTLVFAVLGALLAIFLADVIAHLVRHSSLPDHAQVGHMAFVSFSSLTVLVVPVVVLGFGAAGTIDLATALRVISFTLVATLVVVTLVAVLPLRITLVRKLLVLGSVTALGLLVLALELAVH